jgi:2-pyrone-4,6-dicarboxylate lactonase
MARAVRSTLDGDLMTTPIDDGRAPLCPPPAPVQTGPSAFDMSAGVVDTHAHVIGGPPRYPWMPDRAYTPPPATPDAYIKMLDDVGSQYGVLVQVSVHGQDNSLMLETLAANPGRLRGVVVPALGLNDSAYQAMKDAGAVGMRMNVLFGGGGAGFSQLAEYDALARDWGWHIQFLLDARDLPDLMPRLARLQSPVVIDHMGHLPASAGVASAGFRHLLALVRDGAWVKLSGAYRLSAEEPPYRDTVAYAQALIDVAPGRCVWGSDWPHVSLWNTMPTVGQLLDTLALWAPDPAVRNAILTTNAHQLYGFR